MLDKNNPSIMTKFEKNNFKSEKKVWNFNISVKKEIKRN